MFGAIDKISLIALLDEKTIIDLFDIKNQQLICLMSSIMDLYMNTYIHVYIYIYIYIYIYTSYIVYCKCLVRSVNIVPIKILSNAIKSKTDYTDLLHPAPNFLFLLMDDQNQV